METLYKEPSLQRMPPPRRAVAPDIRVDEIATDPPSLEYTHPPLTVAAHEAATQSLSTRSEADAAIAAISGPGVECQWS